MNSLKGVHVRVVLTFASITLLSGPLPAESIDVSKPLQALRQVMPHGEGHRAAMSAWQELAQADAAQIPEILEGMTGANRLAMNWIRAVVDSIAEDTIKSGNGLPTDALEQFLGDRRHDPRARRLAFEWLERSDPSARARLIPSMLDDPSLELRRDAVAFALEQASLLADNGMKSEAIQKYRATLSAARDVDQIEAATKALSALGVEVDLPAHFGFLTRWKVVGPFDNSNLTGFAAVFPPETSIDLEAQYHGKLGKVAWTDFTTDDKYGMVDLNRAVGKHNGVTAYAFFDFVSSSERNVELRLGSINANKVWLNGVLLTANEVYHTNTKIDQYVAPGRLNVGSNEILVKVCQNEQTKDWAQRWQFQLRVCDKTGTAVLPESQP